MKTWNAGKDRKVSKWVDVDGAARRDRVAAFWLLAVVGFVVLWAFIVGVYWGQIGRDCTWLAQNGESIPSYCNYHVLDVA